MKENAIQLLIGVGLMVGCAILAVTAAEYGIFSSTLASWVQGIGTIAAFGAALWAGQVPLRAEAARRDAARRDFARAAQAATEHLARKMRPLEHALMSKDGVDAVAEAAQFEHGSAQGLHKLLAQPLTDWPTHEIYEAARQLPIEANNLIRAVQTNRQSLRTLHEGPAARAWRMTEQAHAEYDAVLSHLRALLNDEL